MRCVSLAMSDFCLYSRFDVGRSAFAEVSSLRQFVEVLHKRHRRAVEGLDFRIRRFNNVIFIWRVGAAAVAETEMAGRKLERFAGKNVTGI